MSPEKDMTDKFHDTVHNGNDERRYTAVSQETWRKLSRNVHAQLCLTEKGQCVMGPLWAKYESLYCIPESKGPPKLSLYKWLDCGNSLTDLNSTLVVDQGA